MTIARVKTWIAGDVLSAVDLNAEFNNVVNEVNVPSTFSITATGSTTARTLATRAADWINVLDYGAIGDGVTNDAAAVQAAIDAAVDGSTIIIPAICGIGVAGLLLSSRVNLTITGMGAGGFKALAAPSQTVMTGSTLVKMLSCTNCRIVDTVNNGNALTTNIFGYSGNTGCRFENNIATSGGASALVVAINNTDGVYRNNRLYSSSGTARGLWCGNVNTGEAEIDALIEGNTVKSMGASGIVFTGSGGRILGNHCESNAGSGITVSASAASGVMTDRAIISGNTCRSNTLHGIQSDCATAGTDYTSHVIAQGNLCELNSVSGIYAANTRDWTITGNICRNNNNDASGTGAGIYLYAVRRATVTANACDDTRAGASRTQDTGVNVVADSAGSASEDVVIYGNTCRNNLTYGILVTTSGAGTVDSLQINGNNTPDNGGYGIFVTEGSVGQVTNVQVSDNLMLGNTTTDFRLSLGDVQANDNRYSTSTSVGFTVNYPLVVNDTTPSVKGRSLWRESSSNPTTITMFDDGVMGKEITILFTTANTTITDGGNIKLSGAFTSSADDTMQLMFDGTNWHEIGRSVN